MFDDIEHDSEVRCSWDGVAMVVGTDDDVELDGSLLVGQWFCGADDTRRGVDDKHRLSVRAERIMSACAQNGRKTRFTHLIDRINGRGETTESFTHGESRVQRVRAVVPLQRATGRR